MSLISRQLSCACCAREFSNTDEIDLEPLIDPSARFVAVHHGESTFVRSARESNEQG